MPTPTARATARATAALVALAAALAALLLLSACSDPSGGSVSADRSGASGASASSGTADGDSAGGSAERLADTSGKTSGSGGSAGSAAQPLSPANIEEPSIISTGTVSLRARDVAAARAEVQRVAATYAGRVTDQETTTAADGRVGFAHLVLRVPARSFTEAMAALEGVGHLVDSSTTSEDVSTQVVDVDERVKAARASIDRIRLLLSRAEKIGDVMAIESQLASREADLNSLLRQQAHLADQTALSTISVDIDRRAAAARPSSEDHGFLAGLSAGWHALRSAGTGVATVVGVLLPWVPVALLLGLPGWLVLRRLAARRTGSREPAAVPAES